jgi:Uma2 family endonuclease
MTATTQVAFDDDLDYELVDGENEIRIAEARRGRIGAKLIVKLGTFLENNPIGEIYNATMIFQVGANKWMPDVSVVSSANISEKHTTSGKWHILPDLVVEIIPPDELWEKVHNKVREYFAAGVQQVWLISQREQQVMIYDSPTQIKIVTAAEDLTSEALLPGFKCRVADLFQH